MNEFSLDLARPSASVGFLPSSIVKTIHFHCTEETTCMAASERRVLTRFNIRTPLRFRTINLVGDRSDHFTEAINVSGGGFYFATSAPLKMGIPIEATLKMPAEVTGGEARMTCCTARVVRVKSQPYRDGRMGFGMEIEQVHAAEIEASASD